MIGSRTGVGAALALGAVLVLAGSMAARSALAPQPRAKGPHALAGPGALRTAAEHNPHAAAREEARPLHWRRLEQGAAPGPGVEPERTAAPEAAVLVPAARPFVLKAGDPDREQALKCLTAAIYYEAALEPRAGQEAVAQVVLNRLRHPGYPKSVCGVVFQGADRPGCQFSFACDGSMARPPAAWAWRNAREVAEQALDGYVMKDVGLATHYHTSWVSAWWTPTVQKIRQIGAHIFFRPLGAEGQPQAFHARYEGREAQSSRVDLIGRPEAATAAPPLLLRVSATGSVMAPRSVVKGGRRVALPPSTVLLDPALRRGGAPAAAVPPMHAMIALRAAAARAARSGMAPAAAPPVQQLASAQEPVYRPSPAPVVPRTVMTSSGFETLAADAAPAPAS